MNIGIDVKPLEKNKAGIGIYLEQILKKLNEIDKKNTYYLYTSRELKVNFELNDNFIVRQKVTSKIGELFFFLNLHKMIEKDNIDVFWGPEHILPRRSKNTRKIKYVLTVHDLAIKKLKNVGSFKNTLTQKLFLKRSIKNADKIIAISEATKTDVVDLFNVKEDKIDVIYNGTNFEENYNLSEEDTQYNIDMALQLQRMFRKKGLEKNAPRLVVALYEEAGSSAALLEEGRVFFQELNAMQFTYRELVQREADQQAQALHRRYQGQSAGGKEWKSLGTFTQNSNRAVVWDIPNKRLLAGDMSGLSEAEREAVCWELARYEHRRWNAFHYARGWTVLPLEELTEEEREHCVTKHPKEKRHACLVDWEELDALPQPEPGILKRYDYENVVQLMEALQNQGQQ